MSVSSGYSLFVQQNYNKDGNIAGCALAWTKLTQTERKHYNRLHLQKQPEVHGIFVGSSSSSSHERVGGHGEVSNSSFSYLSTNVAKTMIKNGWSKSLTESTADYVKYVTSFGTEGAIKGFNGRKLLIALAKTQLELTQWIQDGQNRQALTDIIVSIFNEKDPRKLPTELLDLDSTYAALENPNTDWNNGQVIDRIRPLYLIHASLLSGGDRDLLWWFF